MKFTADGVEISYEVSGEGPPLVLSHGVIESSRSWDDVVPLLSDRFTVVNYDARARGHSSWDGKPFGYAELAADVEALAAHLGLERFHHAGHSMGGRVALEHALAFPARVDRLAVISARAEAPSDQGRQALLDLIATADREGPGAGVGMWTDPSDPAYARIRAISAANTPEGTRAALQALVDMGTLVPSLGRLGAPTLVVTGDRDRNYHSAQIMAETIPDATLRVLPGGGHFPNFECPELLAEALVAFFAPSGAAG